MVVKIINDLFSTRCHLKSLQLGNIRNMTDGVFYGLLPSNSSFCINLRRLHIRLFRVDLIEYLIDRLPNIEELLVECLSSLEFQTLTTSDENWSNKVKEICFCFYRRKIFLSF
jgi:hypothetical protein